MIEPQWAANAGQFGGMTTEDVEVRDGFKSQRRWGGLSRQRDAEVNRGVRLPPAGSNRPARNEAGIGQTGEIVGESAIFRQKHGFWPAGINRFHHGLH